MKIENKEVQYTWVPTLKWLIKSLAIIYVFIIVMFFLLNFLLKDYMRQIPQDITPWLNNNNVTEHNK